jgi:soluble lytic murein transglycosylase-like protein
MKTTNPLTLLAIEYIQGLGPTVRLYLPAHFVACAFALGSIAGCAPRLATSPAARPLPESYVLRAVVVDSLADRAQSWRLPPAAAEIRGLRLLYDTPVPGGPTLAVVRSIVRSNHRLDPFDALIFATEAVAVARLHHLDPGFFAAVVLQESSFSPDAFSPAGAVGIAQFTLDTAASEGLADAFDWRLAMAGGAALLGRYVNAYDGIYPDPYAAALAAYNAGPGTVAYYRGIPPYPETRAYIADIYDRWARIERDATGPAARR